MKFKVEKDMAVLIPERDMDIYELGRLSVKLSKSTTNFKYKSYG